MEALAEGPGKLLVLRGSLDVSTVADVRQALHAAVDAGTGDLVVDLCDVVVLDATGLGVLVGAHRRAGRCGRQLVLRRVPARLQRLLVATRLHRVLRVEGAAVPVASAYPRSSGPEGRHELRLRAGRARRRLRDDHDEPAGAP